MDYLHGTVPEKEVEAACFYEYARESPVLRDGAAARDELLRQNKQHRFAGWLWEEVARNIDQKHDCGTWFIQSPWNSILACRSFPGKPWNRLKKREREDILHAFPKSEIQPLHMSQLVELDAMGIFEEFKEMAAERMSELGNEPTHGKPPSKVFPLIDAYQCSVRRLKRKLEFAHNQNQNSAIIPKLEVQLKTKQAGDAHNDARWVHALFTLDFTETKTRMLERFGAWLNLRENVKRLAKFNHNPTGTTGTHKDRLKDLAVWRLYDELGFVKMLNFAEANRKRFADRTKIRVKDGKDYRWVTYEAGAPMPFHDARQGQAKKVPLNEAPLCTVDNGPPFAGKAKRRVTDRLAEIIPWEFDVKSVTRKVMSHLRKTSKISKRNC